MNKKRTDVLTRTQRSRCMSRIKGKNTKPETSLRKALWAKGLRYRIHYNLPGKPDIVFVSAKLIVFVDGCFWHLCPIHGQLPQSNRDFWKTKLEKNVVRDKKITQELESKGWTVLRVWEHEIKEDLQAVTFKVEEYLKKAKEPDNG
ncbi:very short patch repair endonuclease [Desulfatibacillum aliphaticivorans]|uniref:very short patch repair endonuclease n=1 Tax=Desulfatibacillum aliphaticivorans TaxID=218208 RepID=UPI000484739C|nr:very short patch repair endonuclease [Desulfatibacillum aliphaticivorans]